MVMSALAEIKRLEWVLPGLIFSKSIPSMIRRTHGFHLRRYLMMFIKRAQKHMKRHNKYHVSALLQSRPIIKVHPIFLLGSIRCVAHRCKLRNSRSLLTSAIKLKSRLALLQQQGPMHIPQAEILQLLIDQMPNLPQVLSNFPIHAHLIGILRRVK